ncbi:Ig-like domain-containing protein, partial [Fibrivirga algicola]|uniref:Ig-like domain-containing protein n=1 Tax=Fibrivirga algicola TaxID=2950420 RepID=UPI0040442DA7
VTATVANQTICNGTTATLTANATGGTGFTYNWSPAGTGSTQTVTVAPTATTTYSVTVTNSNGCSAVTTATVTVNPAVTATVSASPSNTICNGNSVTLTAAGGIGYQWSTSQTTATISVTPTTTTVYSVTVTNASGCSAIASATITVNAAITATVNSATLTCQSPVATLSVSSSQTGLTYQWAGPLGFTATTQSVSASTPGTYTVLIANSQTGCSTTAVSTVSQLPGVEITLFTQSNCLNNGTDATSADDYFTVTVQAANSTPGATGRYEVVLGADANGLGGTVLNPGTPNGTPYGTAVTVGGIGQPNAKRFLANGTAIYSLTIRDTNNTSTNTGCRSTRLTGQVAPCSSCLPDACKPIQLNKQQ